MAPNGIESEAIATGLLISHLYQNVSISFQLSFSLARLGDSSFLFLSWCRSVFRFACCSIGILSLTHFWFRIYTSGFAMTSLFWHYHHHFYLTYSHLASFYWIDKEFTILAPKNEAPTRPSPTADDKDRVRQLLLNHIVLGRAVNISSDLSSLGNNEKKKPLTLTTIGGRQLHFKNRQGTKSVFFYGCSFFRKIKYFFFVTGDGSAVVNGVKIIGKEVGVLPNGVIIVLDDYLFMDEYHGDVEGSESQLFPAIPMVTSSDTSESFPMIELGTHDHRYR